MSELVRIRRPIGNRQYDQEIANETNLLALNGGH